MINGMSEDFRVTLNVVRNEIADVNARLNLTMRAMANQAPAEGAILVSRVKIPKPKPFCGARDANALENYIFDLEQYFKVPIHGHTGRALHNRYLGRPEERTSLAILPRECGNPYSTKIARSKTHWQDLRVRLKPWAKAKLYEQRVQDLTSAYAAVERLFDLTSDSQDVRRHQSSSLGRNRNSHPSSPKAVGGDEYPDDKSNQVEDEVGQIDEGKKTRIGAIKYMSSLKKKSGERNVPVERGLLYVDTWINQKQTNSTMIDSGATHNFIIEVEARCLRLCWEKDSERMKAVNSVALPIVGLVKRTTIKLGGWKGPVDFVVVKMDDFDVVLGMEFLLEHQVIRMPSAKCLAITESFPTVVQADIR
ncbi:Asp_protease_2 domain-containing protein [Cucumis melo var. makuwa]|uniref:Asp_protease_2 domain-containing protein n=1 Tax=Cucumis melo var. makuwa TaxID=1194695 RepID=A0A5A7V3F8_CUCMM|nr:Asp_protease_2 domain-containing protein [Cucumis melo var. makuwa]